jgi:hypothetical protein
MDSTGVSPRRCGGGCPILVFGITREKYIEDSAPIMERRDAEDDDGDSE